MTLKRRQNNSKLLSRLGGASGFSLCVKSLSVCHFFPPKFYASAHAARFHSALVRDKFLVSGRRYIESLARRKLFENRNLSLASYQHPQVWVFKAGTFVIHMTLDIIPLINFLRSFFVQEREILKRVKNFQRNVCSFIARSVINKSAYERFESSHRVWRWHPLMSG